jgi:hypothetical protein
MTEERKSPKRYAIALSKAWGDHFPVDVKQIAMEISSKSQDPISRIAALSISLDDFEGALLRRSRGRKWGIAYSEFIREPGKINFTIAHEFGHYELHRDQEGQKLCSEDDLREFAPTSERAQNIEQEANQFASYLLMPKDDYRRQVEGQSINIALLAHCADRYGTSLAASAIKLIDFIGRAVVVVVSKGGVVKWSRSSDAALKLGCFLKKETRIPSDSLTMRCHVTGLAANNPIGTGGESIAWFNSAAACESAIAQPHYGTVFTLLECICPSPTGPRFDDEEERVIDAFDHFTSYSR